MYWNFSNPKDHQQVYWLWLVKSGCCPIIVGFVSFLYFYVARLGGKLEVRCVSGEAPCCSMMVKHFIPVAAEMKMIIYKLCLAELELNLSWLVSAC